MKMRRAVCFCLKPKASRAWRVLGYTRALGSVEGAPFVSKRRLTAYAHVPFIHVFYLFVYFFPTVLVIAIWLIHIKKQTSSSCTEIDDTHFYNNHKAHKLKNPIKTITFVFFFTLFVFCLFNCN